MSTTIAISGKGGSGKTTLAAMIVRHLVQRTGRSVLAVDADPNACLGLALGVDPSATIARIREDTLERRLRVSAGMSRELAFEYAVQQAVVEAAGFDLMTMGRPEGPKCYCAVNHLLRKYLDAACHSYAYVVVDNEAGMEHLSRRTTDAVDHLLVVAEPTALGAVTARRILDLAAELPITVHAMHVVWNKVTDAEPAPEAAALPVGGRVPFDPQVLELAMRGGTVFDLDGASPALRSVGEVLTGLLRIPARPAL